MQSESIPAPRDLLILVPYFGDKEKFRALYLKWRAAFRICGCYRPVVFLTDSKMKDTDAISFMPDLTTWSDVIRPDQPFDVKGALVCAAALHFEKDLLVLDLDAELLKDPEPALERVRLAPIAMPLDHGALLHERSARLMDPFGKIMKLCAGVMYFGPGERSRLVAGYRRAFLELLHYASTERFPWSPPHPWLLEQYAWSLCFNRRGGRVMPPSMNWGVRFLGENADAVVNHDFGLRKWRAPA